jgi:hypothetical protein
MPTLSFDDLIPVGQANQASGLSFDDLIPQAPTEQPKPAYEPIARIPGGARISRGGVVPTAEEVQARHEVADAVVRGATQGVTFGAGDEIYGGAVGAKSWVSGNGYLDTYEQARDENRALNAAAEGAHPWAYGGAKLAGNAAAVIPLGTTAVGARVLGATGGLVGRTLMGGGSGAALGAIQGFNEGEGSLEDRGENALWGAAVGGAGGAIAAPVGALAGTVVRWGGDVLSDRVAAIPGINRAAGRMFAEDVAATGLPQIQARLNELGPDAMLLEASPTLQGRAMGFATQPNTREMVVAPLEARNAGTNARLAAEINQNFGAAPVPSQIEAGLQASRDALSPAYTRVLQGASAVDTSGLAQSLEVAAVNTRGPAQRAAQQVRQMLDVTGAPGMLDPNPATLLNTRHAIDGMLTSETDTNVIRVLGDARRAVDAELAAKVPGIKDVDAQFQELARQSGALQRGSQLLDSGKTAIRPQELAQELTEAAQPQGTLIGPSAGPLRIREGARADLDRVLGTNANDLAAVQRYVKGEGDWNREKLAQIFGADEAARVLGAVDREAAFRDAWYNVVKGPQTAQRNAAARGVEPRGQSAGPTDVGTAIATTVGGAQGAATAYGLKAVNAGGRAILRAADEARNADYARLLTMGAGSPRDAVIQALMQRQGIQETAQALSPAADRVVQALIAAQTRQSGTDARRALLPLLGR